MTKHPLEAGALVQRSLYRGYYQVLQKYRHGIDHTGGLRLDLLCLSTGKIVRAIRPSRVKVV